MMDIGEQFDRLMANFKLLCDAYEKQIEELRFENARLRLLLEMKKQELELRHEH